MKPRAGRVIRYTVLALVVGLLAALTAGALAVRAAPVAPTWMRADAAVVLGAAVDERGRPGPALSRRVRAAAALFHAGRVRWIFTTGGRGRQGTAEGDAARSVLVGESGVPADRVRVERRSRTTLENFRFAAPLLRAASVSRSFVVTDRYHLARALRMARDMGLDAQGLAADRGEPRSTYGRPWHLMREAVLLDLYTIGL